MRLLWSSRHGTAVFAATLILLSILGPAYLRATQSQLLQNSSLPASSGQSGASTGHQADQPPVDLSTMHRRPYFWTVMAASVMGWVIGVIKGFDGSKQWLAKYWSNSPAWVQFLLDLLIFVAVGAYAGTGVCQPETFQAAIVAGFTWPVAIGALASK